MSEALKVRDLMHAPAVTVSAAITLSEAARILDDRRVGAAAVVADGGQLTGIVTERDLLRTVGHGIDPHNTTVGEVMTSEPVSVGANEPVARALEIFRDRRFRHLPVVENGGVTGILSIRHVVRVAHIEEVLPAGALPPGLAPRGLEGVAVAETSVGDVRGEEGFYHYRGYDATQLARRCSFEQVWHLLLRGTLPDQQQLRDFRAEAVEGRRLPDAVDEIVDRIARLPGYSPLEALRSAVSVSAAALGLRPTLDLAAGQVAADALRMAALTPVLLMRLHRAHQGLPPVEPDPDLGYAGPTSRC